MLGDTPPSAGSDPADFAQRPGPWHHPAWIWPLTHNFSCHRAEPPPVVSIGSGCRCRQGEDGDSVRSPARRCPGRSWPSSDAGHAAVSIAWTTVIVEARGGGATAAPVRDVPAMSGPRRAGHAGLRTKSNSMSRNGAGTPYSAARAGSPISTTGRTRLALTPNTASECRYGLPSRNRCVVTCW
jgi:hypothetical protein